MTGVLNAEILANTGCSPFGAIIVDGTKLCSIVLDNMRRESAAAKGTKIWSADPEFRPEILVSGGLIASQTSPSLTYEVPSGAPAIGRRHLLAGVVGDVLDLFDELHDSSKLGIGSAVSVKTTWSAICSDAGVTPTFRAEWSCGRLLSLEEFCKESNLSHDSVQKGVLDSGILRLRWWDGSSVYPMVQIDQDGSVFKYLPQLLRDISPRFSRWQLALWLGYKYENFGQPAGYLREESDYRQLKEKLDEFELLAPDQTGHVKLDIPPVEKFTALFRNDEKHYLSGSKSDLRFTIKPLDKSDESNGQQALESPPELIHGVKDEANRQLRGVVYRITQNGYGPFYFSTPRDAGPGGRYDVSVGGNGSCYVATEAIGAIREVFARVPVLNLQDVCSRVLWTLVPLDIAGPYLNLTDSKTTDSLNLSSDIVNTKHRQSTQRLANRVSESRFRGLIYPLRRSLNSGQGLALFGPAGSQSGNGDWHIEQVSLFAREELWVWFQTLTIGTSLVFFSQLPAEVV